MGLKGMRGGSKPVGRENGAGSRRKKRNDGGAPERMLRRKADGSWTGSKKGKMEGVSDK